MMFGPSFAKLYSSNQSHDRLVSMSLSRPDFDVACKSLIGKYATHPSVPQNIQYKDWSWSEHSVRPSRCVPYNDGEL